MAKNGKKTVKTDMSKIVLKIEEHEIVRGSYVNSFLSAGLLAAANYLCEDRFENPYKSIPDSVLFSGYEFIKMEDDKSFPFISLYIYKPLFLAMFGQDRPDWVKAREAVREYSVSVKSNIHKNDRDVINGDGTIAAFEIDEKKLMSCLSDLFKV